MPKFTIIEKLFDNQLVIYKRSLTSISARIYLGKSNNVAIYQYKTIREKYSKEVRKEFCEWFYTVKHLQKNNQLNQVFIKQKTAKTLIQQYLTQHHFKTKRDQKNEIYFASQILKYLQQYKIKHFSKKTLHQLSLHLTQLEYSSSTIKHYFNMLRRMYRDLLSRDEIKSDDVPEFPKLQKRKQTDLTYLTFKEYRHLLNISSKRCEEQNLTRLIQLQRKSLHQYLIFMVGTGLRREESIHLRFRDIQIDSSNNTKTLEIKVNQSKTGKRIVISRPSAYHAFENLKKLYSKYSDLISQFANDLLFPRSFVKSAKELFRSAKIDIDESTNLKRNLTTTRKTYICWALENGENIYDIARNCGNSVEVIQKSYADKLPNIALKNRLRQKSIKQL